jgi:tyrosinase
MADGITMRQNVASLESRPDDLAAVRNAYSKMQAFTASDNRGWMFWAGYHGQPQWQCWHHGKRGQGSERPYNLFLPWHRAYLLHFEHTIRDQDDAARLAWWDWTSDDSHQIGIPTSFADAEIGGARNPLRSGPVPPMSGDPGHMTVRFPQPPDQLPTADQVSALLDLTSFVDFTFQLEDIHDQIHGWVGGQDPDNPDQGGDMGVVAVAAYDPIFWAHHCMIDRIWYLWQLKQGLHNIPSDYLTRGLAPFSLTVEDVLDVNKLGYDYADSAL